MQNYMFLGLKSPCKAIFSLHFAQMALSVFAILAGLVASGSVFLNDLYFWGQSSHYVNPYLCFIAFLLAFSPRVWGLVVVIFLLPISAGLGAQLNAYLGAQFLILPNAGLDLVAGFFLGSALRVISKVSQLLGKKDSQGDATLLEALVPWPIALVIAMITVSTAIAISRNVYQSAAATSWKGLLFNLVHFRPIGWHDDYMPISDWIAYALAVAMIILVIGQLKNQEHKNQMIFRSLMAGLIVAALMGISQAITGIGLPENLLSFRKDRFGYAVIGFQPDLHAFAGHMLLGAVGLWGYFYSGISKLERKLIFLAVALCWVGLILSKSRALLLIALAAMFVWLVWYLWKKKRRAFLPAIVILATIFTIFVVFIFNFSNDLSGIPVLSWLGELAIEFKGRDLTSWSMLSGIFGSRFEIWEAAIRMWWEFPLLGVGQGNFYRLSDIASFSKSHYLILNHGENAHNYFLQTLTETGLIGISIFSIAFMVPYSVLKNQKILILPALIALISLLLGNIFSHSFLVRENLILVAVVIGTLFAFYGDGAVIGSHTISRKSLLIAIFMTLLTVLFGVWEVYASFDKKPFEKGYYCYLSKGLQSDGWSSGEFTVEVPANVHSIILQLYRESPKALKDQLDISFFASKNGARGVVLLPEETPLGDGIWTYEIKVSEKFTGQAFQLEARNFTCFTPRNLGISTDSRRLGVRIVNLEFR